MINMQLGEILQVGICSDAAMHHTISPTNGEWETTFAAADCSEAKVCITEQVYQQPRPKVLPEGKIYLRKLGWRILPIVSNGEKKMRH